MRQLGARPRSKLAVLPCNSRPKACSATTVTKDLAEWLISNHDLE
jgi:hypothetical protein